MENGWVRKKIRLQRGVRKRLQKYHNTETKLLEILKITFGRENVIASVHPLWAFSSKGVLLEYDVGVPKEKLLVEYNGIQHYEYPNFFHKTRQEFEEQKERDKLKIRLAQDNGWHLLVIKCDEEVTYGSILGRLSKFMGKSPKELICQTTPEF